MFIVDFYAVHISFSLLRPTSLLASTDLYERASCPEHFPAKRAPLRRRECVKTIGTAFPNSSKTGTNLGGEMAIYQAGTNGVQSHSIVTFFRTFERTKLYDLLAATPLIAW